MNVSESLFYSYLEEIKGNIFELDKYIRNYFPHNSDMPIENTYYIGTVEFGEKVRVSDPFYDLDVQCAGTIDVVPGKYRCFYTNRNCGYMGWRVVSIRCILEDAQDIESGYLSLLGHGKLTDIDVGVDSGNCGIYDEKYFASTHSETDNDEYEKWREKIFELTFDENAMPFMAATIEGKGMVASSGFGDGGYSCTVWEDEKENKAIAIKVEFIEENDFYD